MHVGLGFGHSQRHVRELNCWFVGQSSTLGHWHLQVCELKTWAEKGHLLGRFGHSQRHVFVLKRWGEWQDRLVAQTQSHRLKLNTLPSGHDFLRGHIHLHSLLLNTNGDLQLSSSLVQRHLQVLASNSNGDLQFSLRLHWHWQVWAFKTLPIGHLVKGHTHLHVPRLSCLPVGQLVILHRSHRQLRPLKNLPRAQKRRLQKVACATCDTK